MAVVGSFIYVISLSIAAPSRPGLDARAPFHPVVVDIRATGCGAVSAACMFLSHIVFAGTYGA